MDEMERMETQHGGPLAETESPLWQVNLENPALLGNTRNPKIFLREGVPKHYK